VGPRVQWSPVGAFVYYRRFGIRVVGALGIDLTGCDIPIGIRPRLEALTVDIAVRGSGFLVAREVPIKFASPRSPTSRVPKGKTLEKTVGDRTPEWEWKSIDSSATSTKLTSQGRATTHYPSWVSQLPQDK
jgi:hypothetical protein